MSLHDFKCAWFCIKMHFLGPSVSSHIHVQACLSMFYQLHFFLFETCSIIFQGILYEETTLPQWQVWALNILSFYRNMQFIKRLFLNFNCKSEHNKYFCLFCRNGGWACLPLCQCHASQDIPGLRQDSDSVSLIFIFFSLPGTHVLFYVYI